jgi:glucose-1-phosphate thymidylyltransferase
MLAGIRNFVVITTPEEQTVFKDLFFDVQESMGIRMWFAVQDQPRGIADAFNVVRERLQFDYTRNVGGKAILDQFSRFALALGDNIFYGAGMSEILSKAANGSTATIFATKVRDPERFGVVELAANGEVLDLEEKPKAPKSDLAITGLYFFNSSVFSRVQKQEYSARNELEITDLIKSYHADGPNALECIRLPRGAIWFDTGTADSLLEAANMIAGIQKHQGFMVGNPHEVAYNKGWIDRDALRQTALLCEKSAYGQYLLELL